MPPKVIPPRLHVLIASEAPYAVVLRRWPSKETTTFGWDLTSDTFTYGQWMKARTYEERCDLTPDGKHFLYYAMAYKERYESYFGISIAPYLKALGYYIGHGSWSAGGNWIDSKTFVLGSVSRVVREPDGLKRVKEGTGRADALAFRLLRCGWSRPWDTNQSNEDSHFFTLEANLKHIRKFVNKLRGVGARFSDSNHGGKFVKKIDENWTLLKTVHCSSEPLRGKGSYWEDHKLINESKSFEIQKPDWEWADYDAPRDRILYAEKGKIFAVKFTKEGLGEPIELFDSTQYGRDPVIAPY